MEWTEGVQLLGAENALPYFEDNYANLKSHASAAVEELDRLTKLNKILWYPVGSAPADLCVCPGNIVIKGSRSRVVHDWSKVGLNPCLFVPEVKYGTMDDFLRMIHPNCYMAGLDFMDCFLHWKVHANSRRRLGVRHSCSHVMYWLSLVSEAVNTLYISSL